MIETLIPFVERFNWNIPITGVYVIHHRPSNKVYVGSSGDLRHRSVTHRSDLKHSRHSNPNLQEAYNNHPNIEFVYYETEDREKAYDLEQLLFDYYGETDRLFNVGVTDSRKSTKGVPLKSHVIELHRQRQTGVPLTEEHKEAIRHGALAASWSRTEEQRKHLSELKKGKPQPEHIQAQLRERNAKRAKGISVEGIVYDSVRDAARLISIDRRVLGRRLRSDKPEWRDWFFV